MDLVRRPHASLAVLAALALTLATLPAVTPVAAQPTTLIGTLHVSWGDPMPGVSLQIPPRFTLADDQGATTELQIDDGVLARAGGMLAVNRTRVTLTVNRTDATGAPAEVLDIRRAPVAQSAAPSAAGPQGLAGPVQWVSILCRFADSTSTTPHDRTWFETLMTGPAYPGLDDYWRVTSYNNINLSGSQVVG